MADTNTVGDQIDRAGHRPRSTGSASSGPSCGCGTRQALTALMDERDDLRGVHALADYFDDAVRWSA